MAAASCCATRTYTCTQLCVCLHICYISVATICCCCRKCCCALIIGDDHHVWGQPGNQPHQPRQLVSYCVDAVASPFPTSASLLLWHIRYIAHTLPWDFSCLFHKWLLVEKNGGHQHRHRFALWTTYVVGLIDANLHLCLKSASKRQVDGTCASAKFWQSFYFYCCTLGAVLRWYLSQLNAAFLITFVVVFDLLLHLHLFIFNYLFAS